MGEITKPTDKQMHSILHSDGSFNIWEGAVRSGKSVGANFRWIEYCINGPEGHLVMIGKTERTIARNVLDEIEAVLPADNFSYSAGNGIAHICGRVVEVIGANDTRAEGKIRGRSFAGAYVDELTLIPDNFIAMLDTRLDQAGATMFGTTNPDSPYHYIKKDYIDRQKEDPTIKVFHFDLDDNKENLDPAYILRLKSRYSGLFYKRFIDGLWVLADGVIYDMFDEDAHVYKETPPEYSKYIVGGDFGMTNPTCFGLFGYDDPKEVMMVKEYYHQNKPGTRQKTPSEYADDLVGWLDGIYPEAIYLDPSASALIEEVSRRKIDGKYLIVRKANNSVIDGINFVCNALNNEDLRIHESCVETTREYSAYSWDKKAQLRGEDKPMKVDDHCMDFSRYAIFSHFGSNQNIIYHPGAEAKEKTYAERFEESFEEIF